MELLLEGHGIMGFVDGTNPCPPRFDAQPSSDSTMSSNDYAPRVDSDAFRIWKIHDQALMQLIIAILSLIAISCAIGNISA